MSSYDAILLSGGSGSRLGGISKADLELNGITLLNRVLRAVATADHRIVVGPDASTDEVVQWCREYPPGGGPVAGIAAGLTLAVADVIVLLAVDLPWIAPAIPCLLDALETGTGGGASDAAALVDRGGRVNYLAAAWRRVALTTAMREFETTDGVPMRALYSSRDVVLVPDIQGWGDDCDTPADLQRLRQLSGQEPVQ